MDSRFIENIRVSKKMLLFEAASIWMFAGIMLLTRGKIMLESAQGFSVANIFSCLGSGILFYLYLFSKISFKHIQRIKSLPGGRHYPYQFFNFKSYLMMAGMITMGITLRKTLIIPLEYLSLIYCTMGIPLFLSSIRFFSHFIRLQQDPIQSTN
ncbi:MAG: hypothetical protein NTV75_11575 [Bacteroidia bacterium]|nr:hypothetical protein [Bacteroidia bacterium]